MKLEDLLGEELYAKVNEKLEEVNSKEPDKLKHIRYADLSEGEYVSKGKFDSKNNITENALMIYVQSDDKYQKALIDYIHIRKEIEEKISTIQSDELQAIAIYRYLYGMTIEQIAKEMHYSVDTIKRRKDELIKII